MVSTSQAIHHSVFSLYFFHHWVNSAVTFSSGLTACLTGYSKCSLASVCYKKICLNFCKISPRSRLSAPIPGQGHLIRNVTTHIFRPFPIIFFPFTFSCSMCPVSNSSPLTPHITNNSELILNLLFVSQVHTLQRYWKNTGNSLCVLTAVRCTIFCCAADPILKDLGQI